MRIEIGDIQKELGQMQGQLQNIPEQLQDSENMGTHDP